MECTVLESLASVSGFLFFSQANSFPVGTGSSLAVCYLDNVTLIITVGHWRNLGSFSVEKMLPAGKKSPLNLGKLIHTRQLEKDKWTWNLWSAWLNLPPELQYVDFLTLFVAEPFGIQQFRECPLHHDGSVSTRILCVVSTQLAFQHRVTVGFSSSLDLLWVWVNKKFCNTPYFCISYAINGHKNW